MSTCLSHGSSSHIWFSCRSQLQTPGSWFQLCLKQHALQLRQYALSSTRPESLERALISVQVLEMLPTVLHGAVLRVKHELSWVASAFVPLLTSSWFIPQRDQTAYFLSWLLSNYLSKQWPSIFPFPVCHYELFSSKLLPLKGKGLYWFWFSLHLKRNRSPGWRYLCVNLSGFAWDKGNKPLLYNFMLY